MSSTCGNKKRSRPAAAAAAASSASAATVKMVVVVIIMSYSWAAIIFFCHQLNVSSVSAFVVAPSPNALRQQQRTLLYHPHSDLNAKTNTGNNDAVDADDWRAFRARLVQNGLPGTSSSRSKSSSSNNSQDNEGNITTTTMATTTTRYAHECTPLVEVGTILLSIPTTDLCQALELQFWHRSVVLITAVCQDKIKGQSIISDELPKEKLARGARRGRWTYRGLLLNRMTDLTLFPKNKKKKSDNKQVEDNYNNNNEEVTSNNNKEEQAEADGWRIMRGGDLASLDMPDGHTEFVCLHTLDLKADPNVAKVSTNLIGNLSIMSLADAQELVAASSSSASSSSTSSSLLYTPADFYTFGGFCSWRPGQLETEMGESRKEWLALSVDAGSILDEIIIQQRAASTTMTEIVQQQQQNKPGQEQAQQAEEEEEIVQDDNKALMAHGLLDAGTKTWRNFLGRIDNWSESRATERIPAGQLEFYDMMLRVWAEENLCVDEHQDDDDDDDEIDDDDENDDENDNENEDDDEEADDDNEEDDDDGDDKVDDDDIDDDLSTVDSGGGSSSLIGPGTLVRATSTVSNDILLFDQEFIRSVVLVLEETPEATIGVILNLPLSAAVECIEEEPPIPLRYGGPIDLQDWKDGNLDDADDNDDDEDSDDDEVYEAFLDYAKAVSDDDDDEDDDDDTNIYLLSEDDGDDDEDSSFIWIHRDASLGSLGPDNGGGSPLGSSGLWIINETDVVNALKLGNLSQDDTMVFSGVCIWEKAADLGELHGGLREQVDSLHSLEIIQAHNEGDGGDESVINTVWDILSQRQEVLVEESLEDNIAAAVDAWTACVNKKRNSSCPPVVDTKIRPTLRDELSDAALRAWIGVNLLGDPLGTFVEVKRRRELRG